MAPAWRIGRRAITHHDVELEPRRQSSRIIPREPFVLPEWRVHDADTVALTEVAQRPLDAAFPLGLMLQRPYPNA